LSDDAHDEVYFQGTDDTLWKVNADGTDQHKVGNNKTKSRPFVILPAIGLQPRVYFQGTDDKLWAVNSDGTSQVWIGKARTASAPFVLAVAPGLPDQIFFEDINNNLWVMNSDGRGHTIDHNGAPNKTPSTPFAF
jgi:outer membrane protein assembly factor BamB